MLGHLGKLGSATQSPRLRLAEPDDARTIYRIDVTSCEDWRSEEEWRALLISDLATVRLIRNLDGHCAGYIMTRAGRGIVELLRFAVRPFDRKCGLMTGVIKALQTNLPRSVVIVATVNMAESMIPAIRLLEKHGFYGRPMPECAETIRYEWRESFSPK